MTKQFAIGYLFGDFNIIPISPLIWVVRVIIRHHNLTNWDLDKKSRITINKKDNIF